MQIKNKNLYYVGGVVRDEILGLESLDIDFCYEGNAIEFAKGMNIVKTNPEYGEGIEEGMNVVLYLSLGKEEVEEYIVPSLLGMTEDEAKKALEKIGLELGSIKRQSGATKNNSK